MTFKQIIEFSEKCFLVLIAGFTVVAMFQEVVAAFEARRVELKDLLLMFIYAEVLTMLAAFYTGQRILITLPLFIAMTALSRLIILQGKEANPIVLLYESGAIVLIAVACWILGRTTQDR
jgi:protein PsiE